MRTIVFLGSAMLMLGLLITDVYSAWYEWTNKGKEKLEYDSKVIPCVVKTNVSKGNSSDSGINYTGINDSQSNYEVYEAERGEKTICINGTVVPDCADILGFWDSWDLEGECVPLQQSGSSEDE